MIAKLPFGDHPLEGPSEARLEGPQFMRDPQGAPVNRLQPRAALGQLPEGVRQPQSTGDHSPPAASEDRVQERPHRREEGGHLRPGQPVDGRHPLVDRRPGRGRVRNARRELVGRPVPEHELEDPAEAVRLQHPQGGQEREIRQVLHPAVLPRARQGVGVQLLGHVHLQGIAAERRGSQAREAEQIRSRQLLRFLHHRLGQGRIQAEDASEGPAVQQRSHPETLPLVLGPRDRQVRMPRVGSDLETR